MAPTAALKVRATGLNSAGSRFVDALQARPRKSRLLLRELGLDSFALKHKGDKHTLPRPVLVCRKPRQSIATINQFLDLELHELDSKLFM